MSWSWVDTECSIHRVQHPSKIFCLPFILMITSWPLNEASASGVPLHESSKVMSHSHGCELTNWSKESPYPARRQSSASQYSSKLNRLRSPNLLDHGLQMYLQTRSITASKFTRSWPPSASTHSLDHYLQVHVQTRLITPSKCISKLARSQPSSVSLHSPDYGLQVHLQSRSITASNCISKLARSPPPSASPNSLDHGPGVYPWVHSILIFRRT